MEHHIICHQNNIPYNEKCDVWSLGCLAYELAALKVPFTGYSMNNLMRRINMNHRVKVPNKYYNHQLWSTINRMLCIRPTARISISQVYNISSSKCKQPYNFQKQKVNMLRTILMTPKINILTDRMPESQYNNIQISPIKQKHNKINELSVIPQGNIAKIRAEARRLNLHNIYAGKN